MTTYYTNSKWTFGQCQFRGFFEYSWQPEYSATQSRLTIWRIGARKITGTDSAVRWTSGTASASLTVTGYAAKSYTHNAGSSLVAFPENANYDKSIWSPGELFTFTRGQSAATKTVAFSLSKTGDYAGNTSSETLSFTVPALQSYTIGYNANGGTGTISSQTKYYGTAITLNNGANFTRQFYELSKWNTAASGSGTDYAKGATYSANAAATMYAQWNRIYDLPVITDFTAYRTDTNSSSDPSDDGGYIRVSFGYTCGELSGTAQSTTCVIKIDGTQVNSSTLPSASGTFTQYYGTYNANAHTVSVKIYDSYYSTGTTVSARIATATYPLDFLVGSSGELCAGIMTPAVNGKPLTLPMGTSFEASGAYKLLIDLLHPVGSIYTSTASTDPGTLFPGTTWQAIQGRFLVGAGSNSASGAEALNLSAGATGGEKDHTITTAEMASHTHGSKSLTGSADFRAIGTNNTEIFGWYATATTSAGILSRASKTWSGSHANFGASTSVSGPSVHTLTVNATHTHDSVGSGTAHNNLPPYLAVYMWKRTA